MSVLTEKSKQNFHIAQYAENEKCYDVAVSRFYYSLHNRLISELEINHLYFPDARIGGTHKLTMELQQLAELKKMDRKYYQYIHYINDLVKMRVQADYFNDKLMSFSDYQNKFRNTYNCILTKLVEGGLIPNILTLEIR